jgi:hypothetical protein
MMKDDNWHGIGGHFLLFLSCVVAIAPGHNNGYRFFFIFFSIIRQPKKLSVATKIHSFWSFEPYDDEVSYGIFQE